MGGIPPGGSGSDQPHLHADYTDQSTNPVPRVLSRYVSGHVSLNARSRGALEIYTPIKPRYAAGASNYDPATNSLLIAGVGDNDLANNVETDWNNWAPRIGFSNRLGERSVLRGGYGVSYYTGRFGFTGGTLSTQFPVLYNIQNGVEGDFTVDGSFDTLPPVPDIPLPANGIISPAPNQAFFHVPRKNPMSFVHSYNLTFQRELGWGRSGTWAMWARLDA